MDQSSFLNATFINFAVNLMYTIAALVIGTVAFKTIDKVFFPNVDFMEEIKRGNIAAAIFASTIFVFLGVVIGFALRG